MKLAKRKIGPIQSEDVEEICHRLGILETKLRAGEISGIAVAATRIDGGVLTMYKRCDPRGSNYHILGALEQVKHRILTES